MYLSIYQYKHKLGILVLCLLILTMVFSQANAATITNSIDYEDGSNGAPRCSGNCPTNTTEQVKSGSKAGKFYLDKSLPTPYRTEFTLADQGFLEEGIEHWLGFDFYRNNWANDSASDEFGPMQIHTRSSDYSKACSVSPAYSTAPFFFVTANGTTRFVTYPGKSLATWPTVNNSWVNIVVRYKLASDASGFVEIWKDGVRLGRADGKTGPAKDWCGKPMRTSYMKVGIYKWGWREKNNLISDVSSRTMYLDNFNMAIGANGYSLVGGDSTNDDPTEPPEEEFHTWSQSVDGGTLRSGAEDAGSYGVDLDGINDYLDAGTFEISGDEMSMGAWVNTDDLDNCASSDCRIISKANGLDEDDHIFMLSTIKIGSVYRIRGRLMVNGVTHTAVADYGSLNNDQWMHIGAIYDGSYLRLYHNGNRVKSYALTGSLNQDPTMPVWIGGNPTSATSRPWKGYIADAQIYDYAITEDEIMVLGGTPPPPLPGDDQPSSDDQLPFGGQVDLSLSFSVTANEDGTFTFTPIPGAVPGFVVIPSQ